MTGFHHMELRGVSTRSGQTAEEGEQPCHPRSDISEYNRGMKQDRPRKPRQACD